MHELTTQNLIDTLRQDVTLTERELVLLDRLCGAIEEIDALAGELRDAETRAAQAVVLD